MLWRARKEAWWSNCPTLKIQGAGITCTLEAIEHQLPTMDNALPWMIGCVVGACTTAALLCYNYIRFFTQPEASKALPAPVKAAPTDKYEVFVLHQGLPSIKGPSGSLSGFCLKMEAFLRVAKIPFKNQNGEQHAQPGYDPRY